MQFSPLSTPSSPRKATGRRPAYALHAWVLLAVLTCLAGVASAGTLTVNGTTAGGPTWNRPLAGNPPTGLSGVGTAVPYDVFGFVVDVAGAYDFLDVATNPTNWDNYLFLYQNAFNPAAPLTNVIIGNDDFPTSNIGVSGFNGVSLATGVSYYLVTTGFANSDSGAYTATITGPGTPSLINQIPEPGSLALALAGVGLLAPRLRRRAG